MVAVRALAALTATAVLLWAAPVGAKPVLPPGLEGWFERVLQVEDTTVP